MSVFKVSLETLGRLDPHPNADRLEIASVEGMAFQFVVLKGKHKAGDRVVYFPVDAVLPETIIKTLGLEGRLAGRDKNRVKTVKLRGEISQGLVEFPEKVLSENWAKLAIENLTEHLGVTKYEPAPVPCRSGQLMPLPSGVSIYDLEGADRFPSILEQLLGQPVFITEKLEGSHFSMTRNEDGEVFVSQRRHTIKPTDDGEHDFWKVARVQGLFDKLEQLAREHDGQAVTLRGEYVGPRMQKNIYKLKENRVYVFELMIGHKYVAPQSFLNSTKDILRVPVLCEGETLSKWLAGRTVQEASNGKSVLAKTKREGIVIKPWEEQRDPSFGRLILKQRSPEYLAKSEF